MLAPLLLSLLIPFNVIALNPIVVKGNRFFQSDTGNPFFFKGVCYQPLIKMDNDERYDPLANSANCKRDIALFKELGLNAIRVYEVDPKKNHDDCMKMLNDAGIYLALDLPNPNFSIDRSSPSYDLDILNHYKEKVDAFIKYSNVAVFFAGNEISNNKTNTDANPFVKAGLRDIKAYLKSKNSKIPVGYANNDDLDTRENIMKYFDCGSPEEKADFYAINAYEWCNVPSFQASGYPKLMNELKGIDIPVFFSEFGCNTAGPREFVDEIKSMFGTDMNSIFSGGMMYEFSMEDNKYGVVQISGNDAKKLQPEFDNLKKAYSDVSAPTSPNMDSYSSNNPGFSCPEQSSNWKASNTLPNTPSTQACQCMFEKLECVVNPKSVDLKSGDNVAKLFNYLCANGADCDKYLSVDGSSGKYGPFSGCTLDQKLSWAFNAAYLKANKHADACKDNAMIQKAQSGSIDDCANIKANINESGKSSSSNGSYLQVTPKDFLYFTVLFALSTIILL